MRHAKWLGPAALLLLLGTGTALAVGGPRSQAVTAEFTFQAPTVSDNHECFGWQNHFYDSFHIVYPGTQTSTHPALSGSVVFDETGTLDVNTGDGAGKGTWTVTDPNTGAVKLRGTFTLVHTANGGKGLLLAELTGSGTLVANFSYTLVDGAPVGELGGDPSVAQDISVVSVGTCPH